MVIHQEEVSLGYPTHIYRVLGHLAEASRESLPNYSALAALLRTYRLKVRESAEYIPPYAELLNYVDVIIAAVDGGLPVPAIPEELQK